MKRTALLAGALLWVGTLGFGREVTAGLRGSFGYGGFLGQGYPPYVENTHYQDRVFFPDWEAAAFLLLGDPLAVQLELMYLRLGAALREDVGLPFFTEYFQADYLASAALLKYRYRRQSLFAGPVLLYRIGPGSYGYRFEDGSTIEADFADGELSPVLFALACGLDYQLGVGRGSLVLELRWLYSFTSFFDPQLYDWHPYAFLASLGYLLPWRR